MSLLQHFFDDHGQILLFPLVLRLVQIHKNSYEGRLPVGGQQGDHLVLDCLYTSPNLFPKSFFNQLADSLFRQRYAYGVDFHYDVSLDFFAAHLNKRGKMGQ